MSDTDKSTGSRFIPAEKSLLHVTEDKRQVALERCESYTEAISDYLEAREQIPCGLNMGEEYAAGRARVLEVLGGTEEDWQDWQWQLKKTITSVNVLGKIVSLSEEEREQIGRIEGTFRWGISP